jgi:hypothetical protein
MKTLVSKTKKLQLRDESQTRRWDLQEQELPPAHLIKQRKLFTGES